MTNVATLAAGLRQITGKSSHKLAPEGLIPAVVYGPKFEAISIAIDRREFERLLHEASVGSTLVDLSIEGHDTPVDVIIKEVRRDEVRGTVQHVDFWAVDMGHSIQTTVAVTYVGSTEGERVGGVVNHSVRELKIEARPKDLPEHIEVDVSALGIGDSLTIADIAVPKGVTVLDDPETVAVSVMAPALEVEEVTEEIEMTEVPEVGKESDESDQE